MRTHARKEIPPTRGRTGRGMNPGMDRVRRWLVPLPASPMSGEAVFVRLSNLAPAKRKALDV